jgi:hypothetical protein
MTTTTHASGRGWQANEEDVKEKWKELEISFYALFQVMCVISLSK